MRFSAFSAVAVICMAFAAAAPISHDEFVEKTSAGLHLISFGLAVDSGPVWKTEDEILELQQRDIGFVRRPFMLIQM